MKKYRLSMDAIDDMEQLLNNIGSENPTAAKRFSVQLFKLYDLIGLNPKMGVARPQYHTSIRSIPCGPYMVFWTIKSELPYILNVIHGSRDIHKDFFATLIAEFDPPEPETNT